MLARSRSHLIKPAPCQLCPPCHARIRYHALLRHLQDVRRPTRHASATFSTALGLSPGHVRFLSSTRVLAIAPRSFPSNSESPRNVRGRYSRQSGLQAQQLLQQLQDDFTSRPLPQDDILPAIDAQIELIRQAENADPKDDKAIWKSLQEIRTLSHSGNVSYLPTVAGVPKSCTEFTIRAIDNWLQEPSSGTIAELQGRPPRPSQLVLFLESLQIFGRLCLPTLLWTLASNIAENANASSSTLKNHMQELMTLWSLAFALKPRKRLPNSTPLEAKTDWSPLPPTDALKQRLSSSSSDFRTSLDLALRPSVVAVDAYHWPGYHSAAILTLALLLRHATPNISTALAMDPADIDAVEPLRRFLDAAVRRDCKPQFAGPLLNRLHSSKFAQVRRTYEDIIAELGLQGFASQSSSSSEDNAFAGLPTTSSPKDYNQTRQEKFTAVANVRLTHSLESRNRPALDEVTGEIIEASRDGLFKVKDELFERAILAQYQMRNTKAAMQLYKAVLASGGPPTQGVYRALMQGAGKSRDYSAAEQHWQTMRNHGLQPDAKAWGIRINNLISGGAQQRGLEALKEMGVEWLTAAHHRYLLEKKPPKHAPKVSGSTLVTTFADDIDGVPRPNIAVANGAIAGLVVRRGFQSIPQVLSWCSSFEVKPDSITYNSLLNLCVRDGDLKEAFALLSRMEAEGIATDSTTWTILLTNLVEDGSLDGLSREEQHNQVMTFMSALERVSNNDINAKGYAMVIDRMLKHYDNPDTANAVLIRMTDRGLQPTPHIYTILMTRYFQDSNLPAVENLWNNIQSQSNPRLDHVFFDRMIEGYATHHTVVGLQPTFTFIGYMLRTNRKPSWYSLLKVAEALAERRDWSRLNQLTEDVYSWERESDGRGVHVGEPEAGRDTFWRFYLRTGDHGNPMVNMSRAQSILREAQKLTY